MQQVATYETVAGACERLKGEGQKVTGRAVLSITGGSLGTVLGHIKEWRAFGEKASAVMPSEMPSDLQAVILRSLGQAQADAAAKLKEEIDQAGAREAEALDGLAEAEKRIEQLAAELAAIQNQAADERQAAEKTAAVAAEKIEALGGRVQDLEIERRQLIEAAEASRTEAAKAQLQVERADQATSKAEARTMDLEKQLAQGQAEKAQVQAEKAQAEKAQAVAEQKAQDQAEALAEAKASITELKAEYKSVLDGQKEEIQGLRADKEVLRIEKTEMEKALAQKEKPAKA